MTIYFINMLVEKAFTSDAGSVSDDVDEEVGSNDYYQKVIVMMVHTGVWIMVNYIGIGISLI